MSDKLTGLDYMTRSLVELSSHPDFSPHVWRIVDAIKVMNTDQLSEINLLRSAK